MRLSAAVTTLLLATWLTAQDPLDDLPGLDDAILGGANETGLRVTGLRGFLESRGRYFIKDRLAGDHRKDGQWIQELELEIDFTLTDSLSGYFRPRFLIDAIDDDLVRTEPLEAYVTWSSPDSNFDIRAGQLIENWGIADTFNPVDVLNRRDLAEDVLDPARLGELGARVRWKLPGGDTIGQPILSLYAVPTHRTTSFPTRRNRFSFATPPDQLREDLADRPNGRDRWFLALRGQATVNTTPANADVQLVAARGPDRFPLFTQSIAAGGGSDLVPFYYGMWTLGGGVRAVPNHENLAAYTLKAEVVYKVPYRFDNQSITLPDEYLQYAIGFDRVIPNVFTDKDQITATLEWVGETGANDSTAVFRPFDDDLVIRAFWEANDFARTSVELRGFADPNKQEYLVEGTYQRQLRSIHEDLQLELGLRWFDIARSEPGFFNLFPDNSSVWVSVRLDF
jgi:hypothetical protein